MVVYQDASETNDRPPASLEAFPTAELRPVTTDESAILSQDDGAYECEEMLIMDCRANLGPAQQVEHKLSSMLGGALLPVSHVRMLTQLGSRVVSHQTPAQRRRQASCRVRWVYTIPRAAVQDGGGA
jgi:hypothetical protein